MDSLWSHGLPYDLQAGHRAAHAVCIVYCTFSRFLPILAFVPCPAHSQLYAGIAELLGLATEAPEDVLLLTQFNMSDASFAVYADSKVGHIIIIEYERCL